MSTRQTEADATATKPQASGGRYVCPACHLHFGSAPAKPWPASVPWYRPQGLYPSCPHCGSVLRSKYSTRTTRALMIAAWIAILCAKPFADHSPWPIVSAACVLTLFVALPWLAVIGWREFRDPQRFVVRGRSGDDA